jgi:hypothetical protein
MVVLPRKAVHSTWLCRQHPSGTGVTEKGLWFFQPKHLRKLMSPRYVLSVAQRTTELWVLIMRVLKGRTRAEH